MEKLLEVFLRRFIIRLVGKYSRYLYFYLIGKERTIESLSNTIKDGNDLENALSQDFKNAVMGVFVLSVFLSLFLWFFL